MKREWLLVIIAIGLVAFLNGCCKKYICPDCSAVTAGSGGSYQSAGTSSYGGGSYSGAKAVK